MTSMKSINGMTDYVFYWNISKSDVESQNSSFLNHAIITFENISFEHIHSEPNT